MRNTRSAERRMPRGWMAAGVLGLAALTLTGCGTLAGDNSMLQRDVYDLKTDLKKFSDQQASTNRQITYSLNTIDKNQQDNNDVTKAALDDIERRIRDQNDQIDNLRKQLQEMTFSLSTLSKQLGMTSGANGLPTQAGTGFGSTGSPDTTGAGATSPQLGGMSPEQLMARGQQLYNLQNYQAARDAFQQALAQNPQGDSRTETLFWLAESDYKLNQLDEAKANYMELIKTAPTHPKAWASLEQLANISIQQGDKQYALVMLQQIENNYPSYPEIGRVKATIARIQAEGTTAPAGAMAGNADTTGAQVVPQP